MGVFAHSNGTKKTEHDRNEQKLKKAYELKKGKGSWVRDGAVVRMQVTEKHETKL